MMMMIMNILEKTKNRNEYLQCPHYSNHHNRNKVQDFSLNKQQQHFSKMPENGIKYNCRKITNGKWNFKESKWKNDKPTLIIFKIKLFSWIFNTLDVIIL